ncbi:MAG: hypothetical protein U9R26_06055 [Campylobacterota bacterium]|nr:hypothetical protein [Campylobacterota bacterium]
MRAEILLYIVVAAFFGYFLLGYIKQAEGEGDKSVFGHKASIQADNRLHHKDSIGQTILDFSTASEEEQTDIWKRSPLHQEFMDLVPNFTAMRDFVQGRIIGEDFKQELLKQINEVEDDFFSGKITEREAKEKLDSF